jgi:hypothetical protein
LLAPGCQGYLTKEIAAMLGISESRVYKHVLSACRHLGVQNRGEAGRVFAEWEAQTTPSAGGSQWAPIFWTFPNRPNSAFSDPVSNDTDDTIIIDALPAQQQDIHSVAVLRPTMLDLVPLRLNGRKANDLSASRTLIVIAAVTVGIIVTVGSAVSLPASPIGQPFHHHPQSVPSREREEKPCVLNA